MYNCIKNNVIQGNSDNMFRIIHNVEKTSFTESLHGVRCLTVVSSLSF